MMKLIVYAAITIACLGQVTPTFVPQASVTGASAYEMGLELGKLKMARIAKLFADDGGLERDLKPWMNANPKVYQSFCDYNQKFFPLIWDELRGVADGANVNFSDVLLMTMRPEIEALLGFVGLGNCFDIIVNPAGDDQPVVICHNEDWTPLYKDVAYVLEEYQPFAANDSATHVYGLAYPGLPLGFTFGWNDKGVVTSCNGLFPFLPKGGMLARYFINRHILSAASLDDALERLRAVAPYSTLGFGMSVGMVGSKKVYHAEMAPEGIDIIEIVPGSSYLHSNKYTHEAYIDIPQNQSQSTDHRLARAEAMEKPTDAKMALNILGDTEDATYPIYRSGLAPDTLSTIATAVFELGKSNPFVQIYGDNPKTNPVAFTATLSEPDM